MLEPSRIMPNIYYLGFKTGQVLHYISDTVWKETHSSESWSSKLDTALKWIWRFPSLYGNWWWNLVRKDPIHVLVETTLLLSIVYILVARSKDWKDSEEYLSEAEQEELIREWKLHGRAQLTPTSPSESSNASAGGGTGGDDGNDTHNNTKNSNIHHLNNNQNKMGMLSTNLVVHKVYGPYMDVTIEGAAGAAVAPAVATTISSKKKVSKGSAASSVSSNNNDPTVMTVLNFGTFDYLGMSSSQPTVRQVADEALTKYGCGACGPRGFYGTIDVHLELEKQFAAFLGTDGAILYSDGASTCASTVAAFAKRGDLLVCDEGIYEPLRTGVTLSRAHVKWFKHNDMGDLRHVLQKIQAHDKKVGRPINAQRRFLVVEGLYKTTGTICPLKELVALKHEFKYRLILDESHSFGTLGKTGRGCHEYHGCRLMHDVEITTIALENSMGAVGGITVGTEEVVEHQRLSGSGYCFSASSPPFTAASAIEALRLLQTSPDTTLQPLHDNIVYLHHKLTQLCHAQLEDVLLVTSAPASPIVLLQVADIPETRDLEELLFLGEVAQACLRRSGGGGTGSSKRNSNSNNNTNSSRTLGGMALVVVKSPPGIRITVSAAHTHEHLDTCLRIFHESVEVVMSSRSH